MNRWTEFQGGPNRVERDAARVTLNARGTLLLNRRAYEALEAPAAVTLLFDEHEHTIGLKPAELLRQNAFPVKQKDKNAHNHIIHASPFCKHFDIRVERTVQFNDVDIDPNGVMKLELHRTSRIGRGRW